MSRSFDSSSAEHHLNGNVVSVPIIIEDSESLEFIKRSTLFIHVSKAEYESESEDPNFINMSLTAGYEDGTFHYTLTKKSISGVFRTRAASNENIEEEEYASVIQELFPLDNEDVLEQERKYPNLQLSVKISAKAEYYDAETKELIEEDNDPNQNPVELSIKTDSRVPVTVAIIELTPVNLEEEPHLKDEGNLFNWMDLLLTQNQSMVSQIKSLQKTIETLKEENFQMHNGYQIAKNEYKFIIDDLEQKFYQVLNAKKDKIWELTKKTVPTNRVEHLNQEFLKDSSKLVAIDKDMIPDKLDDKYLKQRKRKTETKTEGLPKKRARRGRKKAESEEQEVEENKKDITVKEEEEEDLDVVAPRRRSLRRRSDVIVKKEPDSQAPLINSFSDREILNSVLEKSEDDEEDEEASEHEDGDEYDDDNDLYESNHSDDDYVEHDEDEEKIENENTQPDFGKSVDTVDLEAGKDKDSEKLVLDSTDIVSDSLEGQIQRSKVVLDFESSERIQLTGVKEERKEENEESNEANASQEALETDYGSSDDQEQNNHEEDELETRNIRNNGGDISEEEGKIGDNANKADTNADADKQVDANLKDAETDYSSDED